MPRDSRGSDSAPSRTNARSAQTRRKLIRAVSELLGEHDVDDVSMRLVAARAKVNITTAYKHFTPKPLLFEAVTEPVCAWFDSQVTQHIGVTPFFKFARTVYSQAAEVHTLETDERLRMLKVLAHDVKLAGALRKLKSCQIDGMTRLFAREFGLDPQEDSRPGLVASMIVTNHMDIFATWTLAPRDRNFKEMSLKAVNDAEDLLNGGIGELKRRR